jgi:phage terminase large subunit-like protein
MPNQIGRRYVDIARRYAEGVVSGKILACQWTVKACQRQLDDLKSSKTDKSYPYIFNPKRPGTLGPAERVCAFVEKLPHIKGEWAKRGEKIRLEPWQIFIYTTVFGWVSRETGLRRFRIAYLEVARKNAKSTMSAPVGIYMTCADGEQGAEVYSAATTRDQAKVVWETAKFMVEREAGLRQAFAVDTTAHSIYQKDSASRFQALSAEGNSLDGLNIHCAIVDELHAHRTRKVYDVLETARGARQQPLLWLITTAGFDRSGICYEQRSYLTHVLDRTIDDPTYFGVIHTIDENDDWTDPKVWPKANPNLNVSVYESELRPLALKAQKMPSALNNFLTKHLSVWVSASVSLFNITKWQSLANPRLQPEQFHLDPCWIGLDFAPRNDFTSRVMLFKREEDGSTHYYVFARHFLSEGKVEESENAQIQGWAQEGWISTNPGNQTDDRELEEDVVDLVESGYQVQEVDCDPSRMQGVETRIAERSGATVVEVPQNPSNLCPPTELLSALIADGKIHHNGDPVLTWMLSNTVGIPKGNWGLYPGKEFPENKIDGITALLTALSRAMGNDKETEPEFQAFFIGK